MRGHVFAALVRQRKFGKKLTNNFIILCELLRGSAQAFSSHEIESADASGEGRFLMNGPDALELRGFEFEPCARDKNSMTPGLEDI
ncbi:hypothetical protein RCCGEPOP_07895 [Rhizobium sp. Pop5]|nr:hypothetical protein RCCGEPOP_07895 [Rhizobium sp. Pop5]